MGLFDFLKPTKTAIKAKESPMVSIANYYESARLEFRKKVIEQLSERDKFTIFITSTNEAFTMSKQEFYDTFNNVASSDSYKIKGIYSYTKTPQKTYKYLSNSSEGSKVNNISNLKIAKQQIPNMTKYEAIKEVNKSLHLNLNSTDTNWSNINSNGIWSMEPNCARKKQKLYLLLNNNRSKKIHVFEIPANHTVYDKLYVRNDKNVYRLLFEVSDNDFVETLKHINFKNFHKGFINYL